MFQYVCLDSFQDQVGGMVHNLSENTQKYDTRVGIILSFSNCNSSYTVY